MNKFVIFGSESKYNELIFNNPVVKNSRYIGERVHIENWILRLLNKIHCSKKINTLVNLPFKQIWSKFYFKDYFDSDVDVFIFFANRDYLVKQGYWKYLKRKYPKAKFVLYFRDLVSGYKTLDIQFYKDNFDLLITYDDEDAAKFNIIRSPDVYVAVKSILSTLDGKKSTDVFFVGKAKNRLDTILYFFEYFRERGITTDFSIIGVPEGKRKYEDEINYSRKLPYLEVLQRIMNCNCILDIIQEGSKGFTLRIFESIVYNKRLITNNTNLRESYLYDSANMRVIEDSDSIDTEFIRNRETVSYDDRLKERLSLEHFLQFIEEKLKLSETSLGG